MITGGAAENIQKFAPGASFSFDVTTTNEGSKVTTPEPVKSTSMTL